MANYVNDVSLHIPGTGHILFSDPGTEMFDLSKFVFDDDTKHTGWTWIGDASAESPFNASTEGGEQEVKPTWDRPNARTKTSASTTTGEIKIVGLRKDQFKLFFGATDGKTGKSLKFNTPKPVIKQLVVVTQDGQDISAMRYSRVSLVASLPEYSSTDDYVSYTLKFTVLDAHTGDSMYEIFPPQPLG